jgi:putative CocE/NonD family hydrolase
MYGFSYAGATQLLAALAGPPELKAICPGFTWSQAYDGGIYTGGAFNLAFAAGWATLLAQDAAAKSGQADQLARLQAAYRQAGEHFWTLPLTDFPPLQAGYAPYFKDWLDHPLDGEYWARWSIEANYHKIKTPALHIGGWYDAFIKGTIKNFSGLKAGAGSAEARRGQKLLAGPWWHMPWHPLGEAVASGRQAGSNLVDDWQLRWFDHFLKAEQNGVLEHPVTAYQLGRGWQDLADWPPPGSRPQELFLHSGGRANSAWGDGGLSLNPPGQELPDIFTYSPAVPVLSAGGHSCCRPFMSPMGSLDQSPRENANTVLVYTTDPWEAGLSLMGRACLVLFAASTAQDTDFTARLCRVDAQGLSMNLQEGIVRARYRESLTEPKPLEPGAVYEYHIDLGPVCAYLKPGERLRLALSSSDFPQWDRNLNTGGPVGQEGILAARTCTQTVLHDENHPSRLIIQVSRD